jgi:DNA-binding XRE family transcriptional regulator
VSPFVITPRQIRAARGLMDWTQGDLADSVGISRSTIAAIEKGTANPSREVMDNIRATFERSRVEFLPQEGVRIRHPAISEDDAPDANRRLLDDIYFVASRYKLQRGTNDILIFGVDEEDTQNSVGDYISTHLERLREAGLQEKILCGPDARTFIAPRTAYRRLSELDPAQNPIHIYGDRIAIVHWKPKEFVITIESEPIASATRSMFYLLWKLHGGID